MNSNQLTQYYNDNNVQSFHGIPTIDALKHLSEINELPKEIKEDYYSQYVTALVQLGNSNNKNLGDLLYEKFTDEPVQIIETVGTYTFKGITFNAVKVEIPHFRKLSEYFVEKGINIRGVNHTYVVLDININGVSTLEALLNKPKSDRRYCIASNPLLLCNEIEYAIINSFQQPYNGIEAKRVVEIFESIVPKNPNNRYSYYNSDFARVESYLEGVIKMFSWELDVKSMIADMKELFKQPRN